jgi:aconitase A
MAAAAAILRGRHLARGVRGIVIPATMQVYRACMRQGYTDVFLDAGCIVSTPTCGPCLGGYMGMLAAGERCVSTTNRNFVGRMGHVDSEVYLASPATWRPPAADRPDHRSAHPEEVKQMNAKGTVLKYGDNVDTDVIIPARYLATQDQKSWPATAWRTSTRPLPTK